MDLSRLSEQDLRAVASNDLASVSEAGLRIIAGIPAPQPAEGVGAAFRGGLEGLLSRARTGVEAIFDPEEAARRGLERSEDIGQRFAPGASLQRVKDVYAERGLLPAAGEAISQIPSALAEQAPNIAATLASAKLGAMAGTAAFPGVGTVIGGVGGALAPSLTQLFGSNIERQAEEGEDISRGRALAAAVPGAALEVASTFIPLGRTVVGKILGPKAEAALATGSKNNAKLVEAGLLRTLGTGTVVGAGLEVPTEVIQQMLERAQAGLDLTSDDALAEYGEAAYGAALVGGPFGAAGRVGQRSIARSEAEQKALAEQAAEEAKTAEETRLAKEAEEAEKATPEYEQKISDRLQAVVAEFEELKEIKKQKDLDPDVTKEVGQKINELQKERKKLEEELQQSRRLQGKVPTLKSIQEELRAKAQTAAEEKSRAEAEKDRAEAERLGMPLFTGEEASRDLFLDKKGELQASMLPDAEAQELASAEKQELSQTFNKQNRDIEDRLAQLSQQIAQDPTSPAAAAANQEAVKLQRLKKQLVSAAEKQGVKLEVQKGVAEREFGQIDVEPSRAELSDAITKQSSLIRQIKKAADLGDSSKVTKLQTQLQDTLTKISELKKQPYTPDLFGAQNLGRIARQRSREAYAGLLAQQELGIARKTARAEEEVDAEADRLSQVGDYIERLQQEKGIELLGVAPEDKAGVERMLETNTLSPGLASRLFSLKGEYAAGPPAPLDLSTPKIEARVAFLEGKLKSVYETFISELATTGKSDTSLLDKNGMLTSFGAEIMRNEIQLRELKKILYRQQQVVQQRAEKRGPSDPITPEDFERKIPTGKFDEQGEPIFTSPTLGPLTAQLEQPPLAPESQDTRNLRDRNVLMSYFQDAIYALQRGFFSGLRGGVNDPYEVERNEKLAERVSDIQVEIEIIRAQIQAAPQDTQNLERRISTLQARQKILRAGISASRNEAAQTYDQLLREAQQIRDDFIKRATIEVNAVRAAKGLPEIKVLVDDKGNPIADQLNSFISKASNAKRMLGDKRTKMVDEFGQPVTDAEGTQLEIRQKRGDPETRPFAKVGHALDTLQEQIEEDIRRAKGEKTFKDEINEGLAVEIAKPEQKRAIQDRSRIGRLAKEIQDIEAELARVAPPGPELDLVTDPKLRNEILESIVTILPADQRKGLGVGIDGGTFVESAIKKQLELAKDLATLPQDFLFDYVETDSTLGRFLGASGGVEGLEETLRRVQAVRKGPPELREKIAQKKKEIEEVKKELREEVEEFGARLTEEQFTTQRSNNLKSEYNTLVSTIHEEREKLRVLKKSAGVNSKEVKTLEKQIEDLEKQSVPIYEAFKKLSSAEEKVVTYPKTARFSQQVDAMAKLEDLDDDAVVTVAEIKADIKTVKDATKKLTLIDNQLYTLSLQPKTEARTETVKRLRKERSSIVSGISKQFKDLRETTQLPDEEATTIGRNKVKLLADLKTFTKKFDQVTSEVIIPLQKKERELRGKLFKLRGKQDALPDEIDVDSDTAKKAQGLKKEISDTVKELRTTRSELFAKRAAFEKEAITEAAELKARENELYFPYASKLNKNSINDAVNEELKDIDAEIGDLQGRITQLKDDKKQTEERLSAANKLARSGATPEERSQARVNAKEIKAEIASIVDLLNKTNETVIARGTVRDAEAASLAEKFAREPQGRYNKAMGKLLQKLEGLLPDATRKAQRVARARRIVENRVMNQDRMRTDRTDKLADLLQRSLVSFKKRIANSETRIEELERQRLAAATVGRMTTPDGKLLSGARYETIAGKRKVSEEFEISKEQLAILDDEMADLQKRLDEDTAKPADAKDKLSATKRKSLQGQISNRKGRRDRLRMEIDPNGVSIELDRLRAEEKVAAAKAQTPEQKKINNRIRTQIAALERRLRGENQLYEIKREVTLFGVSDPDSKAAVAFEIAQGYVQENHKQMSSSEMETEASTKRQIDRQIVEAEQKLSIEMAGDNKALITQAKAALRELRRKRDELAVYRNRKALTNKQIEEEIRAIENDEQSFELRESKVDKYKTEVFDIDDISDVIDTSGGPIEFRFGESPNDVIDTKEATKRLEEIKKLTDKLEIKFKYYPNIASAPIKILNQLAAQGIETMSSRVKGGVMPDGTVFVIVENHNNMLDLEKTLAHELIGHYSFDSLLGKDGMLKLMLKLDKDLATKVNESGIANLAERLGLSDQYNGAVAETYAFYKKRLDAGEITEREVRRQAKIQGLKELVAYTIEKRVDKRWYAKAADFIKELVRAFRMFLKGHRFSDLAKQSTTELFELMQLAERNFTEGKPMAYYTDGGMVSLRQPSASAVTFPTPLSKMVATPTSALGFLKANLLGMNFRVQFVDRLAALDALVKKGVEKAIIPALKAMDVMYFSRFAGQRNNFVADYLTSGVGRIERVKGEIMYVGGSGPSMRDVANALRGSGIPAKQVETAFTAFLIARRAEVVGVDKLDYSETITDLEVKATLAQFANNQAFQKAAGLYDQYNNNLIDLMVQAEALDPKKAERLKNSKYVPYYREKNGGIELVIGTEKPVRIGSFVDQPQLKELRGGVNKILPVFTGSVQNTQMIVDIVLRNMAAKSTAFVLNQMGFMDIRTGEGPKLSAGTPKANVVRFTIFEDQGGEKKLVEKYAVMKPEVGETIFGNIPTELVVRGMEGIKTTIPGIVRLMGLPANWLRNFVTKNPRYAVNQVFRDSMAAVITTGADFVPVVQTIKDLATMNRNGSLGTLRGRGVVGGQVITGATDDADKILRQITAGKPGWEMTMAKLDEFAMMGDAATRVSMYNSFLKQGLSEREATFASLEAMNFSRRGLSPTAAYANTVIPFFNAQVQGLDVLYRAAIGDMPASQRLKVQHKMKVRMIMMGVFTIAYAAMMEEDEAYENANPEERYSNWFVPTPFGTFRVPIPFELGFVAKSIPEGIYRLLATDDKASSVLGALRKQLFASIPGDLPIAAKVPIELMLNKSFFTGRPVIDARLEGLVKSEQFGQKTPELIKLLGFDSPQVIKDVFGLQGVSPAQVEYFIKGYTGTLPLALLRLFDPVLASGEVVKADMKLEDMPIVGSFFQPKDAGGIINASYAGIQQAQRVSNTYKKLIADGRIKEATEYFNENTAAFSIASLGGAFQQQMGELTKAERAIRASDLSSAEKRERLDEFRQIKIDYSKQFRTIKEQIERQASRSGLQ
jgi:DNA repair exonuclease SbcCD ATPase subunit